MIHRHLPNILSITRLLMAPIFVYLILKNHLHYNILAFFLFFAVSITDFLDGYYARKYNLVTKVGKYLDPLADKVFTISVFVSLYIILQGYIKLWMVIAIIIRDISVMLLRNIYDKKGLNFNTTKLAKYKTLIQIILIHVILLLRFSIQ